MILKIREAIHHFINGIYSGYPLCCVINFIKLDWNGHCPNQHMEDLLGQDTVLSDDWLNDNNCPMYVRCKKCRDNNHKIKFERKGGFDISPCQKFSD